MNITVIIPTYQRLDYLKVALKSCYDQTLLPDQILIGDDSKNDLTEKWISSEILNSVITINYIRNNPGLGQADNVANLIDNVKTKYLLLLHDDDFLMPNALHDLYQRIAENDKIDVVYGKQFIVDDKGNINYSSTEKLNNFFFRRDNLQLDGLSVALRQQMPSNSFLIKTVIAKKVKYNLSHEVGDAVDFNFCLNLALHNANFVFIEQYISAYRVSRKDSISAHSNAGYYSYKLVNSLTPSSKKLEDEINHFLEVKAPIAISQAVNLGLIKDAKDIWMSKYHKKSRFSLGGLRRLLLILNFYFRK